MYTRPKKPGSIWCILFPMTFYYLNELLMLCFPNLERTYEVTKVYFPSSLKLSFEEILASEGRSSGFQDIILSPGCRSLTFLQANGAKVQQPF